MTNANLSSLSIFFIKVDLSASAWCLYDSVHKKYMGFREDSKREVASLTKIMTCIVAIETL